MLKSSPWESIPMSRFPARAHQYLNELQSCFTADVVEAVERVSPRTQSSARSRGSRVYICGNGGSAGNAIHIANDLIYGAGCGTTQLGGINVEALVANPAVLTCLANDIAYINIFSEQLHVKVRPMICSLCLVVAAGPAILSML